MSIFKRRVVLNGRYGNAGELVFTGLTAIIIGLCILGVALFVVPYVFGPEWLANFWGFKPLLANAPL